MHDSYMCNNWEHISYFWISCLVFHVLSDGDYQHIMGGPPVPSDSFNKIIFSKSKLNFGSEIPPDTLFCPRLVDRLLFHLPWSCPIFKLQWTSATVYLYTTTQYLNLRYSDTKPKLQFFFSISLAASWYMFETWTGSLAVLQTQSQNQATWQDAWL